eukprot:4490848-Prymnesium_polylepis.1
MARVQSEREAQVAAAEARRKVDAEAECAQLRDMLAVRKKRREEADAAYAADTEARRWAVWWSRTHLALCALGNFTARCVTPTPHVA